MTVRRHWFLLVVRTVPLIILAAIPLTFSFFGSHVFGDAAQELIHEYKPYMFFSYAAWLLIIWMVLATVWTDYMLDIWCITNRRVIKIDQVAFFQRKTGSFRLERMQDVNVEINGIIATLLNYGTVHIQTASADMEEFKGVFLPKPQEIKSKILEASDKLIVSTSV